MERISWDQYFMAQAHILSLRSTCSRLTVGALIVRDKRVIAGGYNGSVSGDVHCIDQGCLVVDHHCVRTIHAEMNALLQCSKFGASTKDAEIYVTHFPCLPCSKAIIQSGIRKIYFAEDYKNNAYAEELFQHAGVEMKKVPFHQEFLDASRTEKVLLFEEMIAKMKQSNIEQQEIENFMERMNHLFQS
jgi:dCMP deaminase